MLGCGIASGRHVQRGRLAPSLGIERKPEDMGLGLRLAIERLEVIKDGIGLWNFFEAWFWQPSSWGSSPVH